MSLLEICVVFPEASANGSSVGFPCAVLGSTGEAFLAGSFGTATEGGDI